MNSIISVLRNGADNLVSSTVTVTVGLVSMAMNFAIGFVFACYVLLQKEKLGRQALKAAYAIPAGKNGGMFGSHLYPCQ